jgi:hypothetical protein
MACSGTALLLLYILATAGTNDFPFATEAFVLRYILETRAWNWTIRTETTNTCHYVPLNSMFTYLHLSTTVSIA